MGGTSGVPDASPKAAQMSASPMNVSPMAALTSEPPTGAADTGIAPGTPGNPGIDFSKLPAWAEGMNQDSAQSIFSAMNPTAAPSTPSTPVENLGFPAADPVGFQHAPYPEAPASVERIGAAAPPPQAAAAAPAAAAPAEDPNARVAVYLPGGGFGYGTASGIFGSTGTNTYQQRAGPNGSIQAISNPYGIEIGGIDSMNDPWQVRQARELGWLDPASYQQNTTYLSSGARPQSMGYKPGDLVPAGTNNVPTMSKALYDWNMKVYGNPYGAGYTQQYIGGPAQAPNVPGDHQ